MFSVYISEYFQISKPHTSWPENKIDTSILKACMKRNCYIFLVCSTNSCQIKVMRSNPLHTLSLNTGQFHSTSTQSHIHHGHTLLWFRFPFLTVSPKTKQKERKNCVIHPNQNEESRQMRQAALIIIIIMVQSHFFFGYYSCLPFSVQTKRKNNNWANK